MQQQQHYPSSALPRQLESPRKRGADKKRGHFDARQRRLPGGIDSHATTTATRMHHSPRETTDKNDKNVHDDDKMALDPLARVEGGVPGHDTLKAWTRRIALARSMGQFTCALMRLEDERDYEWMVAGFEFCAGSPFLVSDDITAWRDEERINLKVGVPRTSGRTPPLYPMDYAPFGYLIAEWFIPHPLDVLEYEKEEEEVSKDKESLQFKVRAFDKIREAARLAGQLECRLMTVRGGHDYTGDQVRGYTLDERKFALVIAWARTRCVNVFVRVPENPLVARQGGLDVWPCTFGYLMANWEVPPPAPP